MEEKTSAKALRDTVSIGGEASAAAESWGRNSRAAAALPGLYADWMFELLGGPIPEESHSTCQDCAMCKKGDEDEGPQTAIVQYFDPRTKCCTYLPKLANFLVGRILLDEDPGSADGRETIEQRLRTGVAVTPLGMGIPESYHLLYRQVPSAFGRSASMRCPHYLDENGGLCGIWKNRNSVCATWFCKHVRGAVAKDFWRELEQLLSQVEEALASWCVAELGLDPEVLKLLFPAKSSAAAPIDRHELDGKVDPVAYGRIWKGWRGREREFFERCGKLVDALSWEEVLRIGGILTQVRARLLRHSYVNLISTKLPERARVASFTMTSQTEETLRLASYSSKDQLEVPKVLVEILHYFDGRPIKEALAAIAEQEGIKVEEELVRRLLDFRILVEAEPPEGLGAEIRSASDR